MGGLVLAWLAGESVLVWRWAKAGAPPTPGALLLSSGVFAGLALLGQAQQARTLAATLAWGYDLAIFLQVAGQGKVAQATGWPPPMITDPSVILPSGRAHGSSPGANPSNTPAAVGGANKARGAPPGTPANPGVPPTGSGTIYPPGSQSLLCRGG
jgi:hypothetical protein